MTPAQLHQIGLLTADANRASDEGRFEDARDLWLVVADAEEEGGHLTSAWLHRITATGYHVLIWARAQLDPRITFSDIRPRRAARARIIDQFKSGRRVDTFEIAGHGYVHVDRRGRVRRVP